MQKFSFILALAFSLTLYHQAEAQEGCLNTNSSGGYTTPNGYYREGRNECFIASDINAFHTQGRSFDKGAGANYGMPELRDNADAAAVLTKCMAENGVFTEEGGTSSDHPKFESELERCNSLLYGVQFLVKRLPFPSSLDKLTDTHVNILNSALQQDDCIAILHLDILGGSPAVGHALELVGASTTPNGEVEIDVADPNFPDSTYVASTQYSNQSLEMKFSDSYRKLMGLNKEWMKLSAITLKCPADAACTIFALKDLEDKTYISISSSCSDKLDSASLLDAVAVD